MSEFMNTVDNACPVGHSILKIMALWLLFPSWNQGMLTVDEADILTNSKFKLIKTVSDMYYNYSSWGYSKCTNTDTVQTDGINHQIELITLLEYLKVAE